MWLQPIVCVPFYEVYCLQGAKVRGGKSAITKFAKDTTGFPTSKALLESIVVNYYCTTKLVMQNITHHSPKHATLLFLAS
jgi:hypothetical protein